MASPIPFTTADLGNPSDIERVLRRFEQSIQSIKTGTSAQVPSISNIIDQVQQQLTPYINFLIQLQLAPIIFNYVTLPSSTQLGISNAYPHINVCTGAGNTQTLPSPTAVPGQGYYFVQGDANSTTIGGTINGAVNYTLASQYKYVMITSLNGLWYVVINN